MVSGCTISKDSMMVYNEAKDAFQKATAAGAKKCAPVQYATAEAYLALAGHEIAERDEYLGPGHLKMATEMVKAKSSEALKLTPCEQVPPPLPSPPPAALTPRPAPPAPPPAQPLPLAPTPAPESAPAPPPEPAPAPTPAPVRAPAPKPTPVFDTIYFGPSKTNISPLAAKELDRNGMILKDNPQIKVTIEGHTDAGGSDKANQKISEKRAQSVKKYIQDKFNISGDRMTVKGYGASRPIADNKTQEGRLKNRRVEIRVVQ